MAVAGFKGEAERFAATPARTRGPMLGRDAELDPLLGCWNARLSGGVQVVGVVGEAGIGKSRLVEAFDQTDRRSRAAHLGSRAAAREIYGNTPFYVVVQTTIAKLSGGDLLLTVELLVRTPGAVARGRWLRPR